MTIEEKMRAAPWSRKGYQMLRDLHDSMVENGAHCDDLAKLRIELHSRSVEHGGKLRSCQDCGCEYNPAEGNTKTWDGRLAYFWKDGMNRILCRVCFEKWGRRETRSFFDYWHTVPEWERRKIRSPGND